MQPVVMRKNISIVEKHRKDHYDINLLPTSNQNFDLSFIIDFSLVEKMLIDTK